MILKLLTGATVIAALSGCSSLSELNGEPQLSELRAPDPRAPLGPITMPSPPPPPAQTAPNALWDMSKRSFFRDQRADDIGDILTVMIDIADNARLRNSTQRSRENERSLGIGGLFGAEELLDTALADGFDPQTAVDIGADSRVRGDGEVNRNEEISLRVAAIVTERLPNGNFVIVGRQEVLVNSEMRELQIVGIIRPEDITSSNTIDYFKIAEARISYGGRGVISRVQKPKLGDRVYESIVPY